MASFGIANSSNARYTAGISSPRNALTAGNTAIRLKPAVPRSSALRVHSLSTATGCRALPKPDNGRASAWSAKGRTAHSAGPALQSRPCGIRRGASLRTGLRNSCWAGARAVRAHPRAVHPLLLPLPLPPPLPLPLPLPPPSGPLHSRASHPGARSAAQPSACSRSRSPTCGPTPARVWSPRLPPPPAPMLRVLQWNLRKEGRSCLPQLLYSDNFDVLAIQEPMCPGHSPMCPRACRYHL